MEVPVKLDSNETVRKQRMFRRGALVELTFSVFLFWFLTYGYLYFLKYGGPKPFHYYVGYVLFTLFVFFGFGSNSIRMSLPVSRRVRAFYIWFYSYFVYILLQFLFANSSHHGQESFIRNSEAMALLCSSVFLMSSIRNYSQIMGIMAVVALLGVIVNIWDFFIPTFSTVPGRAAGIYENPNISGKIIGMLMIGGVLAVPKKWQVVFIAFCGIGVLVTFSRVAWLLWNIGFWGWLFLNGQNISRRIPLWLIALLSVNIVFLIFLFSGSLGSLVTESSLSDNLTTNTAGRLGVDADLISDNSIGTRVVLVKRGLSEWSDAWMFGHGLGATDTWPEKPHNMYLLFAVEGGFIGLVLFSFLLLVLWLGGGALSRILTLQFGISSLFTHNNLEQPAIQVLIAFAVVYGAFCKKKNQKTSFV